MSWRSRPRWRRTSRSRIARLLNKTLPRGKKLVSMRQGWRNDRRRRLRYINGVMAGQLGYHRSAIAQWKSRPKVRSSKGEGNE